MTINKAYLVEQMTALRSLKNGFENFAAYLRRIDFSRGKRISRLYDYLRRNYKNFEEEDACYFVFGNHETKTPKWRKLRNDLGTILEKYLDTEKIYQNETLKLKTKLEMSRDLHLQHIFDKTARKAAKVKLQDEIKLLEFRASIDYLLYFRGHNIYDEEAEKLLNSCANAQTTSFLIKRFVTGSAQLLLWRFKEKEIPRLLRLEIQSLLDIAAHFDFSYVRMLSKSVRFYLDPSQENYYAFKAIVLEKMQVTGHIQLNIFSLLLNAVNFTTFQGSKTDEYFGLYRHGIEKKLLAFNHRIDAKTFHNVALVAHLLEENRFLAKFVKEYAPLLEKDSIGKNSKKLANCYVYFGQRKYQELLDLLPTIINITPMFTIKKYVIFFKAHCEKTRYKNDAFAAIDEKCRSFWELLGRQRKDGLITSFTYNKYMNFHRILRKATDVNNKDHNKPLLLEMLNQCQLDGKIAESRWLRKIINKI